MIADEALHRHVLENIEQADALRFGRVTSEMIEAGWRRSGHGPTLLAGLSKWIDLKLVRRLDFGSGAVAMRYKTKLSSTPQLSKTTSPDRR
jgi:hypothetical protein